MLIALGHANVKNATKIAAGSSNKLSTQKIYKIINPMDGTTINFVNVSFINVSKLIPPWSSLYPPLWIISYRVDPSIIRTHGVVALPRVLIGVTNELKINPWGLFKIYCRGGMKTIQKAMNIDISGIDSICLSCSKKL